MNQKISSSEVEVPRGAYSQGVRNGRLVFVSGQLPLDLNGNIVPGGAAEQTLQALRNVHSILRAANADLHHLVQVTVYISDIAQWPDVNSAYQSYLANVSILPARAVVPVKELHYGANVEIQAIACLED